LRLFSVIFCHEFKVEANIKCPHEDIFGSVGANFL
jgi:hypothetical protein